MRNIFDGNITDRWLDIDFFGWSIDSFFNDNTYLWHKSTLKWLPIFIVWIHPYLASESSRESIFGMPSIRRTKYDLINILLALPCTDDEDYEDYYISFDIVTIKKTCDINRYN